MDIESAFAKVFGRSPAEDERLFLRRLSGTWNVRGNEALLALLFVLQFGSGHQRYAARCAESVRRAVRLALQHGQHGTTAQAQVWEMPVGASIALAIMGCVAMIAAGVAGLSLGASSLHSELLLGTPPRGGAVHKVLIAIVTASPLWTSLVAAAPSACWSMVEWLQGAERVRVHEPSE